MPGPVDIKEWDNLKFPQGLVDEKRVEVIKRLREEGYDQKTLDIDTIICSTLRDEARQKAWAEVFKVPAQSFPDGWWQQNRGCVHDGMKSHCNGCGWSFCEECAEIDNRCPRCRSIVQKPL